MSQITGPQFNAETRIVLGAPLTATGDQIKVKTVVRKHRVMVRYGLDPNKHVIRNYTDEDEWLIVRRVYEREMWGQQIPANGYGKIVLQCSRRRDLRLLEHDIKRMCEGFWWPGGNSYVEVLPWRADGRYAPPASVRSVLVGVP